MTGLAAKKYNFDKMTILVVDDSAFMRKTLNKILAASGFKNVIEAADAVDALSMLKEFSVDLMVTDWMMDPLDGIELTRIVRSGKDTPNPQIPIILLTGHTELSRVKQARDAGVTEFLAKPVSSENLMKRIIHILEHPRDFVNVVTYKGPDRRRKKQPDPNYKGPERRKAQMGQEAKELSNDDIDSLFD